MINEKLKIALSTCQLFNLSTKRKRIDERRKIKYIYGGAA